MPRIKWTPASSHPSSCAVWVKSVSPRKVIRPATGLTNATAWLIQWTLSWWLAALPDRFTIQYLFGVGQTHHQRRITPNPFVGQCHAAFALPVGPGNRPVHIDERLG